MCNVFQIIYVINKLLIYLINVHWLQASFIERTVNIRSLGRTGDALCDNAAQRWRTVHHRCVTSAKLGDKNFPKRFFFHLKIFLMTKNMWWCTVCHRWRAVHQWCHTVRHQCDLCWQSSTQVEDACCQGFHLTCTTCLCTPEAGS